MEEDAIEEAERRKEGGRITRSGLERPQSTRQVQSEGCLVLTWGVACYDWQQTAGGNWTKLEAKGESGSTLPLSKPQSFPHTHEMRT